MSNILVATFISLLTVSHFTLGLFFHEPSGILIHPIHENHTDFGFAMSYQAKGKKLVVGAPSETLHGKVYNCNTEGAFNSTEITCKEINIDIPQASRSKKKVNFYLGASVAATSDHFLTCAPLWTTDATNDKRQIEVVGTCFFDGVYKNYKGMYEKYKRDKETGRLGRNFNTKAIIGGRGWTTLADEANNLLLVVKSSLEGDITFSPITPKTLKMNSMVLNEKVANSWVSTHFNLGFGITSGKFFSDKTVYAFNMETQDMNGVVEFLDYNSLHLNLMNMRMKNEKIYTIKSKSIGTKFGAVLAAADMDKDMRDDLFIAEPLYTEEDCVDCGALHLCLGGEMETIADRCYLQILGTDNFGRFGSALAVKDLDGDGISELSVSSPYADGGLGVVYIIAGYEVNQKLQQKQRLQLELTELTYTQRIQKENFRTLGFSLQFISDVDDNGCSELVTGVPGSGKAMLFKCVQVIDIMLTSKLTGEEIVRETDSNFTVQVCAAVKYPEKPNDISAQIILKSSIIGEGVYIPNLEMNVPLSCNNCTDREVFCNNVLVLFNSKEPGDYIFKSEAELITGHIFNSTEFSSSWVVATPHSILVTEQEVSRHCRGDDCKPNLSMKLSWSRSKEDTYIVGSSTTETVIFEVSNDGNSSYEACVWVTVKGAQLSRLLDNSEYRESKDGYRFDLPRPLKRDQTVDIKLLLKMDRTNQFRQLDVKAYLHEKCSNDVTNKVPKSLSIPYVLNTNDVSVDGTNHERQIPYDSFSALKNEDDKPIVLDVQEFLITNNGKITWKNIYAKISMTKTINTEKSKVTLGTTICKEFHSENEFINLCYINIMPNSTIKVVATTHILKKDLELNLNDKKLKVEYKLELYLTPTKEVKRKRLLSVLKFERDAGLGQNKLLIGLIAATFGILILIVIFRVLYKYGFFKREEKRKLLVHRESIKQRSYRRNTHICSVADENGIEGIIDVQDGDDDSDDCVFKKDITKVKTGNGIEIKA